MDTDCMPEDMENRRLADLEKFVIKHPNHPMAPLLMQQVRRTQPIAEQDLEIGTSKEGSWTDWLHERHQQEPASREKRQYTRKLGAGTNRWDTVSTLELLTEMTKFHHSMKDSDGREIRVTSEFRWTTIAQKLPNRCGLEQAKFASSCRVHFLNLCRTYKGQKKNSKGDVSLDPQVRGALRNYFQLAGGSPNTPHGKTATGGSPPKAFMKKNLESENFYTCESPDYRTDEDGDEDTGSWDDYQWSRNENHDVLGTRAAAEAPTNANYRHAPQEFSNPHYQRDKEVNNLNVVRSSPLNKWDTGSTLELLAAMKNYEKCRNIPGAKGVNRWTRIASQLPNRCKLDPERYVRSCRARYHELLRVYRRGNFQDRMGHRPLPDEVLAELEDWLQFSSHSPPKGIDISCVKKRNIASVGGVNHQAPFSPISTDKNHEDRTRTITKNGPPNEKYHGSVGLMQKERGLQSCKPVLGHHAVEINDNESSWDDSMHLQPADYSDVEGEESSRRIETKKHVPEKALYRGKNVVNGGEKNCRVEKASKLGMSKMTFSRPHEEMMRTTGYKLKHSQEEAQERGLCNRAPHNHGGGGNRQDNREKGPAPNCNAGSADNSLDPDTGPGMEGDPDEYSRGMQKGWRYWVGGKQKNSAEKTPEKTWNTGKNGPSDAKMPTSGRLQQTDRDTKGKGLTKPITLDSDDESSWDDSVHLEDDQMEQKDSRRNQKAWQGLLGQKEKGPGQKYTGNTQDPVQKVWTDPGELMDQQADAKRKGNSEPCSKGYVGRSREEGSSRKKAPVSGNHGLNSDPDRIIASENESSWDDSLHLESEEGSRSDEVEIRRRTSKKRMRDRKARLLKENAERRARARRL